VAVLDEGDGERDLVVELDAVEGARLDDARAIDGDDGELGGEAVAATFVIEGGEEREAGALARPKETLFERFSPPSGGALRP
jgi:hypothetical protein